MVRVMNRLVQGLRQRVNLIVGRGIVKAVDDSAPLQRLQVSLLNGEIRDELTRCQNYGFTSVPQPDAESVVLFSGGDRGNGVVIAVDDKRHRIRGLAKGEVAIYTDEGDTIAFKRKNKLLIKTKSLLVTCDQAAIKTTKFAVECETAAIKNETGEIVAILSELIAALTGATAGGDLLVCPDLPVIKLKIESFRG